MIPKRRAHPRFGALFWPPGHGVLRRGQGLRTGGIGLATAAVRQAIIKLMPTDILALLIEERDKVNRAIEALQGAKRRSRPPKNALMAATLSTAPKPDRRKRAHTVARRKQQAERMRAYWAAKRKAQAAGKPKKAAKAA